MFKTNQYFDGEVVSIALESSEGRATVGVMAKGEYEFGTDTIEIMTILTGQLAILLPQETEWKIYRKFESFTVSKGAKFKVKAVEDTPYLCLYK